MRKLIAIVLAVLQLGFGGFLIANGGKADRARERRIDEIVENGSRFLFRLNLFSYTENRFAATPGGVAVFGASCETPPAEPYIAPYTGETYYRVDAQKLHALLGPDLGDNDWHVYRRIINLFDLKSIRFKVNGHSAEVYAVGFVYEGDVVYTGLVADGVWY